VICGNGTVKMMMMMMVQRGPRPGSSEMDGGADPVRGRAPGEFPADLPNGRQREVRQVFPQQRFAVPGNCVVQGPVRVRQVSAAKCQLNALKYSQPC